MRNRWLNLVVLVALLGGLPLFSASAAGDFTSCLQANTAITRIAKMSIPMVLEIFLCCTIFLTLTYL